jgi:hypothetical protein
MSVFVHLRAEEAERERWKQAAERSGRSLSLLIRDALEAELARGDHEESEEVLSPSASQATDSARASEPATLEQRLQAIVEIVDRLGSCPRVAPPTLKASP